MPRLRDGVIKRGGSWSYVIRVPEPATGVSKPKWVGGFDTEEDAKAARDAARVRARRGEYVNRSTSTVADYLAEWVEAHASTVKPKTFAGYRHDIDHYIVPRIGHMRLQALRPAVISKLYRDLTEHGGHDGGPLSAITVSHIHRTLRKALADAVDVEQLLADNPAARSKRPKSSAIEPVQVWTVEQLGSFLAARSHRQNRRRDRPVPRRAADEVVLSDDHKGRAIDRWKSFARVAPNRLPRARGDGLVRQRPRGPHWAERHHIGRVKDGGSACSKRKALGPS